MYTLQIKLCICSIVSYFLKQKGRFNISSSASSNENNLSMICFLKALLGSWRSSSQIEFQSLAPNLAKEPWFWFSLDRLIYKLQEEENLVSWWWFSFALMKRLLMLVGTVRHETSNIIEATVSTYNIFIGRIFEEVN